MSEVGSTTAEKDAIWIWYLSNICCGMTWAETCEAPGGKRGNDHCSWNANENRKDPPGRHFVIYLIVLTDNVDCLQIFWQIKKCKNLTKLDWKKCIIRKSPSVECRSPPGVSGVYAWQQWWNVTKYIYSSIVVKYNCDILYLSISIFCYFIFLLTTLQRKYCTFYLITFI